MINWTAYEFDDQVRVFPLRVPAVEYTGVATKFDVVVHRVSQQNHLGQLEYAASVADYEELPCFPFTLLDVSPIHFYNYTFHQCGTGVLGFWV